MTDERFVFNQDVSERSKMKTGARHKKNGCKSKKCVLPSDHLTPSQKKKLNGEVMIIKMNEPYRNWKQFRKLNMSLQDEYIRNLITNHGARSMDIAAMFGVAPTTFASYCTRFNPPFNFNRGLRNQNPKWTQFISNTAVETKPEAKKSDEQILEEIFGIKPKSTESEKPEEVKVEEPKPDISEVKTDSDPAPVEEVKKIVIDCAPIKSKPEPTPETRNYIFNAMQSMKLDLCGTKYDIMKMLDTILDDGNEYAMYINISRVFKGYLKSEEK